MSESVWVAIIKYHRLGGLHSRNVRFTVLEARSQRSGFQLGQEGPLSGQRLIYLHMEED